MKRCQSPPSCSQTCIRGHHRFVLRRNRSAVPTPGHRLGVRITTPPRGVRSGTGTNSCRARAAPLPPHPGRDRDEAVRAGAPHGRVGRLVVGSQLPGVCLHGRAASFTKGRGPGVNAHLRGQGSAPALPCFCTMFSDPTCKQQRRDITAIPVPRHFFLTSYSH